MGIIRPEIGKITKHVKYAISYYVTNIELDSR